jgi:C4-dicarboxylate transporter/malic acid transport protein.
VLWGFTLLLWVVLTYGIFAILTVEEDKPPLEQGINGGWLTVFYWATGTWWIPMLLVLGIWRHSYKRFLLRYDPLHWGAVFPLGMYAASTHELSLAMRLDFLAPLPVSFLYVALLAWTAAFVGALRQLLQAWRKPPGHRTTG